MRIWCTILIYALAEAQGPIIQMADLEVQAATSFPGIVLSSYIIGNGIVYDDEVSGRYSRIDGTPLPTTIPLPTITQGMSKSISFAKTTTGVSDANVGIQPDPMNPNIVFSANSDTLIAYDISQHIQVKQIAIGYEVSSMFTFAVQGQTVISMVSSVFEKVVFIFASFSSEGDFKLVGTVQEFSFVFSLTGAIFDNNGDIINCYVWGEGSVTGGLLQSFSFPLTSPFAVSSGSSITVESFSSSIIEYFNPRSFLIYHKEFGILCDKNEGILVLNITNWLTQNSVVLLSYSHDSLLDGSVILSCTTDNSYIYVATSTSQYAYEFAFSYQDAFGLAQTTEFLYEDSGNITTVSGFASDVTSRTLYLMVNTAGTISFRVLSNDPNIDNYGFMLYDEDICSLTTKNDCSESPSPAFMVLDSSSESFVLVMDAYSSVYIFTCYTGVYLTLAPGLTDSFIFNGTLTISNSGDPTNVPLNVAGWNPASTTIYTTRNILPNDGFEASTNISLCLNSENSISADVYLPLSNYFSGQNILYDVTLASGSPTYVNVVTPPVLSPNVSYSFPSLSPRVMKLLEFNGLTVVAVLSNNTVVLFDGYAQDLTPLDMVSPHYPEYQIMQFVCVVQQYSDISMLVVESQLADGIGGYNIAWDVFNISDPSDVHYETTMDFYHVQQFGQLEGTNTILFSLRLESVFVAEATYNGTFALTSLTSITATSLGIPTFCPVKICTEVGVPQIYIYDANQGLLNVTPASGYSNYSYFVSRHQLSSNPNTVSLLSSSGVVYFLDQTNSTVPLISIAYDTSSKTETETTFPNFVEATYLSLQISYDYLAVLSMFQGNQTIMVFNLLARSQIRNLIAMVPVPTGSSFCFFTTGDDRYNVYDYDGKTVRKWKLGQTNADWHPSSILMPTFYKEHTVWSKITFTFPIPNNQFSYNATVTITATSGITGDTKSTSVSIWLINNGTFILRNPSNSTSSQLTTPGTLYILDTQKFPTPDGFFTGADITYAFVLNGYQGALILPKAVCTPKLAFACITAKEYECQDCVKDPHNVLDFDTTEDYIYFASIDLILRISLQNGTQTMIPIDDILDTSKSYCYLIQSVDEKESYVVAMCEGYGEDFMGEYLLFLNLATEKSFCYQVSIRAFSMKATYNSTSEDFTVFLTDNSRVLVLVSPKFKSKNTYLYAIINDHTLGLPNPITPTSVEYISDSYILLADANTGDMFLLEMTVLSEYSYSYKIVQTLSAYPGFNSTSGIVAIRFSPNNNTVFALSKGAVLYQYSLIELEEGSPSLQLENTVFPVAEDLDLYVIIDTLDVDQTGNYVVYPVFDGTACRVRVVDMSAPPQSRIYTSTEAFYSGLPNQLYTSGSVKIISQTDSNLTVAVSLAPSTLEDPIFQVYIIQLQTEVYIYPQSIDTSLNNFLTLQLVALNSLSKALAPMITLNFSSYLLYRTGPHHQDVEIANTNTASYLYEEWWVWVLIGVVFMAVFTMISVLVLKYCGRGGVKATQVMDRELEERFGVNAGDPLIVSS